MINRFEARFIKTEVTQFTIAETFNKEDADTLEIVTLVLLGEVATHGFLALVKQLNRAFTR
jgi:hypothetical protein